MRNPLRSSRKYPNATGPLLVLFSIGSLYYYIHGWRDYGRYLKTGIYWDMAVYTRAVHDLAAHLDPYRTDVWPPFIYQPVVLHILSIMGALGSLRLVLIASYAACTALFLRQLCEALRNNGTHVGAIDMLAAVAINGALVVALLSGNLTPYLHLAILAVAIHCSNRKQRSAFGLAALIGCLAVIKPYLLAYVGLYPVLFDRRTAIRAAIVSLGALLSIWVAGWALWPMQYGAFLSALHQATLGANDLGYTFFAYLRTLTSADGVAFGLHCASSIALVAFALLYAPQRFGFADRVLDRLLFVTPFLILANPRMKEYDFFAALLCGVLFCFTAAPRSARRILLWGFLLLGVPIGEWLFQRKGISLPPIMIAKDWFIGSLANDAWQLIILFTVLASSLYARDARRALPAVSVPDSA
jgi:hypothetical protein